MSRNLALFGMMGAGKTTIGRLLAQRLGRDLVESDDEVERRAGKPIRTIFDEDGEGTFRALERDVVRDAAAREDRVLSLGGGAVLDDHNVDALRSTSVLVELRVAPETLVQRLTAQRDGRPLLTGDDLSHRVTMLLAARASRYAEVADHVVDASGPPEDVAASILAWASEQPGVLSSAELARAGG